MIIKHGTGIIALLLTACAPYTVLAPPSPELCRSHGVDVADDATHRGEITAYHITDEMTVLAVCGNRRGCTIPVAIDRYEIWVDGADEHLAALRTHEECHALWSSHTHTKAP